MQVRKYVRKSIALRSKSYWALKASAQWVWVVTSQSQPAFCLLFLLFATRYTLCVWTGEWLLAVWRAVRCRTAAQGGGVYRQTRWSQDHHRWLPVWDGDEAGDKSELWWWSLWRSGMDHFTLVWRQYRPLTYR